MTDKEKNELRPCCCQEAGGHFCSIEHKYLMFFQGTEGRTITHFIKLFEKELPASTPKRHEVMRKVHDLVFQVRLAQFKQDKLR